LEQNLLVLDALPGERDLLIEINRRGSRGGFRHAGAHSHYGKSDAAGQASVSFLPSAVEAGPLNPQDFLNLADLLLDLAGRFLVAAFVFQV
jgi:hypothetical protein